MIDPNTIPPIIFKGHNLSAEKAKKSARQEIPKGKKPKATLALIKIYHSLKEF